MSAMPVVNAIRNRFPISLKHAAASLRSPRSTSLPVIGASSGVAAATRARSPDTSIRPVDSSAFCGPMNTGACRYARSVRAVRVREVGHVDIGLAVFARQTKDTHVRIAIATAHGVEEMTRVAFLAGDEGRRRAALSAAAALWQWLGAAEPA